jgi:hypothetical protein
VVAILNDDSAQRDEEVKSATKAIGPEAHAPKKVIDLSLRKEPMPHGRGFLIDVVVASGSDVLHVGRERQCPREGARHVDLGLSRSRRARDA